MKTSLIHKLTILLFLTIPVVYLIMVYPGLPETVPLHYGSDMEPDRFGPKNQVWIPIAILLGVAMLSYFLITNITSIDPKASEKSSPHTMRKFATVIVCFFSLLSMYIIYSTAKGEVQGLLFILLGALFAVLGNLMYNIKPNYFIGMRLPWTLHNDENWKLTHRLAGKLWVAGGMLLCLCAFWIPPKYMMTVFLVFIIGLTVWPAFYSYKLYKQGK